MSNEQNKRKSNLVAIPYVKDPIGVPVSGQTFFEKINKMTGGENDEENGVVIKAESIDEHQQYRDFTVKFPSCVDVFTGKIINGDAEPVKIENVNPFNTGENSVCFIDIPSRLIVLSIFDKKKGPDDYSGAQTTDGYIQNIITRTADGSYQNIINLNTKLYNAFNIGSDSTLNKPLNKDFTVFPMYHYPTTTLVDKLYFVYNKLFNVGDIYCDKYGKVIYGMGGHIVYCNEEERFTLESESY